MVTQAWNVGQGHKPPRGINRSCQDEHAVGASLVNVSPIGTEQETAKDGMAGMQSGNKIWEDWLRTSLNAMFNIRYCMTLKFEWTKSRSQKLQQNLRRSRALIKVYKHTKYNVCNHLYEWKQTLTQRLTKIIKWPWTEKVNVRVT